MLLVVCVSCIASLATHPCDRKAAWSLSLYYNTHMIAAVLNWKYRHNRSVQKYFTLYMVLFQLPSGIIGLVEIVSTASECNGQKHSYFYSMIWLGAMLGALVSSIQILGGCCLVIIRWKEIRRWRHQRNLYQQRLKTCLEHYNKPSFPQVFHEIYSRDATVTGNPFKSKLELPEWMMLDKISLVKENRGKLICNYCEGRGPTRRLPCDHYFHLGCFQLSVQTMISDGGERCPTCWTNIRSLIINKYLYQSTLQDKL